MTTPTSEREMAAIVALAIINVACAVLLILAGIGIVETTWREAIYLPAMMTISFFILARWGLRR